jgi:O-antigen/teichoic acid export membrane protein
MGSRILNYISANADYLLIAKFLSATSLGLYTLAYHMAVFPLTQISTIITRVTFPTFSTIQDDNARLRVGYLKAIKYTSLITFPMLAGLAVVAPEFIPIVIGEKWMPMVLPLQILCIAGVLKSVGTQVGTILLSKGRSDIQFKWNIFATIVLPIAILVGVQHGITGVATAITVVGSFLFLIIQKITNNLIDLSFHDFFKALYPAAACSTILIVSMLAFQRLSTFISLQDITSLIGSMITGTMLYMLAIWIIDNNSLKEIMVLFKQARGG